MKPLSTHGSSSLQFMMKLMVWHFCEGLSEGYTALIVVSIFKVLLWRYLLCNLIDVINLALHIAQ